MVFSRWVRIYMLISQRAICNIRRQRIVGILQSSNGIMWDRVTRTSQKTIVAGLINSVGEPVDTIMVQRTINHGVQLFKGIITLMVIGAAISLTRRVKLTGATMPLSTEVILRTSVGTQCLKQNGFICCTNARPQVAFVLQKLKLTT